MICSLKINLTMVKSKVSSLLNKIDNISENVMKTL